ncbi:MAG TPA: imidazole glycerol phosphate synthase subunit HisH [Allosphingosinicella sp.]|nr:imidazole glycerol phosphate synthase subunit HisH [Allosphingosinicella sp.]
MRLAIVDLGCGNIGSIGIAFRRFGVDPEVTSQPGAILSADKVILPGVGASGFAMAQIDRLGLREPLRKLAQPVLGICLGMQILFDHSDEDDVACLGLIGGKVRALHPAPGLPVPHMGWSRLDVADDSLGVNQGDYVYFAHSFACDEGPETVATVTHGRRIPAVVRRANFLGAQFHPERSSDAGARFLENWLGS